jgi:beta-phosphoglucomutase-like phosphatase (HAD superfamily)
LLTTGGKERIGAYIDSLPLTPADQRALTLRIPAIHKTKTDIYTSMILDGKVPLRDGATRLFDEAEAANVKLAIASTTTLANIEALLRANLGPDALRRFAAIGAGDQVLRKKPAPDIYEYVVRQLGVPAEECVAIEDSSNGLVAAKTAGLYTVVTPSYWTRAEDFSAADLVLPSLGSDAHPLPARAAALLGSTVLGIREIDRQLDAMRVYE